MTVKLKRRHQDIDYSWRIFFHNTVDYNNFIKGDGMKIHIKVNQDFAKLRIYSLYMDYTYKEWK